MCPVVASLVHEYSAKEMENEPYVQTREVMLPGLRPLLVL